MTKGATCFVTWLAIGLGVFAGCNGGVHGDPVEGTVTLDGKPLPEVHLIFYPVNNDPANHTRFVGLTDQQGRFAMRSDDGKSEGVPPGKYRVTLTTAVARPTDNESTPLPPERVPANYRNGKQEFDVPQGGNKQANFAMKSR
jgi:hypothetical protein